MNEVDFLVISFGSGLDVANAAANQRQSVAVVEKGPLGGTCLNRGCISSKRLLYHADVLETVEVVNGAEEGTQVRVDTVLSGTRRRGQRLPRTVPDRQGRHGGL
ncbi:dihydrolipoyl dehydrogenase [Haloarcula argentinensis DSM 12282]|nr:dihydrolipoyl dehydrogenase [Haloarcula argentinensis DSM 12282]